MKLWEKGYEIDAIVERYTVGKDPELDQALIYFDCIASKAHAHMLHRIGVLDEPETDCLVEALDKIIELDREGRVKIRPEDEDCHTVIEGMLVEACGEAGKKIHTARSRNDQVLTALRLYEKETLSSIKGLLEDLGLVLKERSNDWAGIDLAGYTHTRKAMPLNAGVWAGSFEAAIRDDLFLVDAALKLIDKSPLGTAAGFGVPVIKIDREGTAQEMGFAEVLDNPVYAQHSRSKYDAFILDVLTSIMLDLNRLASDVILFSSEEFGYLTLSDRICSGSSIMPQKKNPDIFEIMRGNFHVVQADAARIKGLSANLISGYHRDIQLSKEAVMRSMDVVRDSLSIAIHGLKNIDFDPERCRASLSPEVFATHRAYKMVRDKGVPFREAYRQVAGELQGEEHHD